MTECWIYYVINLFKLWLSEFKKRLRLVNIIVFGEIVDEEFVDAWLSYLMKEGK